MSIEGIRAGRGGPAYQELRKAMKETRMDAYTNNSATHHGCTLEQLRATIDEARAMGPIVYRIDVHPVWMTEISRAIGPPQGGLHDDVFNNMKYIRLESDPSLPIRNTDGSPYMKKYYSSLPDPFKEAPDA